MPALRLCSHGAAPLLHSYLGCSCSGAGANLIRSLRLLLRTGRGKSKINSRRGLATAPPLLPIPRGCRWPGAGRWRRAALPAPAAASGEPRPREVVGAAAGQRVAARAPSPFDDRRLGRGRLGRAWSLGWRPVGGWWRATPPPSRAGAVPPPAPMAIRCRMDDRYFVC